MKHIILSNKDSEELGKDFLKAQVETTENHVIVHVSTFYNTHDEEHKAVIFYEN